MRKGVRLRLGKHWVQPQLHRGARIFFFVVVCAVRLVLCSLYSQRLGYCGCGRLSLCYYLLCEGVGTIVLRDGGGSCLCKHLCCGLIVASGL